jgi:hypothetical protein
MSLELLNLHQKVLNGINTRRDAIRQELAQLDTVAAYHQRIIDELMESDELLPHIADAPAPTIPNDSVIRPITHNHLLFATRHEACRVALKELGGEAPTPDIVKWLLDHGYGQEFRDNPRSFHNGLFTAMVRHPEIFVKAGRGAWKLAS